MKLAFIDIETTGLNPLKHEIIELGCIIADSKTFEVYGKLNFKIKPQFIKKADPKALLVNGYNEADWKDAMPLMKALMFFAEAVEGSTLVGHNIIFDWSFLRIALENEMVDKYFKVPKYKIDTISLAWGKIPHSKVQSWSLKTICTYLGIPPEDDTHRALAGAEKCFEVYKKLMEIKCNSTNTNAK